MKTYTHEELMAMHRSGTCFLDHNGINCRYVGVDGEFFLFRPIHGDPSLHYMDWAANSRLKIMGSTTKVLGHLTPVEPNHG